LVKERRNSKISSWEMLLTGSGKISSLTSVEQIETASSHLNFTLILSRKSGALLSSLNVFYTKKLEN